MQICKGYIISILILYLASGVNAQNVGFNGQAIGWSTINPETPLTTQLGARYIPEMNYQEQYEQHVTFEANLSLNAYVNQVFWVNDSSEFNYDIKPYRFWVKYSGERMELRGGLQKINFGSAQLLRPLMWFDKIDPRDPLQLTDGVYGGLIRFYFLNNANIWFWTLIANDEPKGWEILSTLKTKPEVGGRVQFPFLTGELATTYHFRKGNIEGSIIDTLTEKDFCNENRFGLDFKLDYELGFWLESAIIHQEFDFTKEEYKQMHTIGADYTFNIGSGLSIISEYFTLANSDKMLVSDKYFSFGALSLNYPVSIIHNLGIMFYVDFENEEYYRFINWSMQYDKWSFYAMAFWNPDQFQIYQNASDNGLFSGKGFQLMAIFNH